MHITYFLQVITHEQKKSLILRYIVIRLGRIKIVTLCVRIFIPIIISLSFMYNTYFIKLGTCGNKSIKNETWKC